ncbi:hypothetical protein ACS0TY_020429 [Phlomoides rotata]
MNFWYLLTGTNHEQEASTVGHGNFTQVADIWCTKLTKNCWTERLQFEPRGRRKGVQETVEELGDKKSDYNGLESSKAENGNYKQSDSKGNSP